MIIQNAPTTVQRRTIRILAARLYFLDGLGQVEIGKIVNVSQAKVSRMLATARERGLVRITVPEYDSRSGGLEDKLKSALGVEAVVIRAIPGLKTEELRQTIGYFAAPVRERLDHVGRGSWRSPAGGRSRPSSNR